MNIDFDLMQDSLHDCRGEDATLVARTGERVPTTVLSVVRTAELDFQTMVQTHILTARMKVQDLVDANLDRDAARDALLEYKGQTWRVKSYEFKPLGGDSEGELTLILINEARR